MKDSTKLNIPMPTMRLLNIMVTGWYYAKEHTTEVKSADSSTNREQLNSLKSLKHQHQVKKYEEKESTQFEKCDPR